MVEAGVPAQNLPSTRSVKAFNIGRCITPCPGPGKPLQPLPCLEGYGVPASAGRNDPIPDKLATFHDHQKLRVTPAEAGTPYLTLVFAFANQHIAPRK